MTRLFRVVSNWMRKLSCHLDEDVVAREALHTHLAALHTHLAADREEWQTLHARLAEDAVDRQRTRDYLTYLEAQRIGASSSFPPATGLKTGGNDMDT